MNRTPSLLAAAGVLALALVPPALARDRFPLELTVKAEDGSVVASAAVRVTAAAGEPFTVEGTTDRKGRFRTELPDFSRSYLARVEKSGFELLEQTLNIGERGFEAGTTVEVGLTLFVPNAKRSLDRGMLAYQGGKRPEAETQLRQAIALDPQLADAYALLARVLYEQDRKSEAGAVLEQGTAALPASLDLLNRLALFRLEEKRFDLALAAADKGLVLQPQQPDALRNRFDALAGLGRADEAEAALDALVAVERTPDSARLLFNSGVAAYQAGKTDRARSRFTQAIELDPTLHQAHSALAEVHIQAQEWDAAVAELDRSLAIAPRNFRAWERKIEVLRAAGRVAEAAEAERRLAAAKQSG